ncbi:PREDICTED: uncharacterized protein LOC104600400 [Nelumbo nucifera]|uniref:Uncharacterized protein LOC104600400 n=1 Tax=Nelumbo nucifera TaxID=4432 RepID=A0A1U8A3H1_NELNU|nr:PREDICTED: uncharacterized protein LOC104600400 [Nelumbo nucifera]
MEFSSTKSSNYHTIYHVHKLTVWDIFKLLVSWRSVESYQFVQHCHEPNDSDENFMNKAGWFTVLVWMLQKMLIWFHGPLKTLGHLVEAILNLVSRNGGIVQLFLKTISGSLPKPIKENSKDFQSFLAHVDGRKDLYKASSGLLSSLPAEIDENTIKDINVQDLCMMAAKVAYENKAYATVVVNKHWKMHLGGFFQFYNDYTKKNDTQAFICCDKPKKVRLIIVSFRGTEMFNADDWLTDLDLSWISFGGIGRVHLGFMKALGLHEDETNGIRPREYSGENNLAYYTIRQKLRALLEENPDAKILVTGHSLGGALAILFVSGLVYHQEAALLNSLLGVYTFGQPRVGDESFGRLMEAKLKQKYFRVVYRYDIVPRLPFGDPITQFAHFGNCIYYSSWYKAQVLREEPNENYINPFFLIPMHFNACLDLLRAFYVGRKGKSFEENSLSLFVRLIGILVPGVSSHFPRDYINSARLSTTIDQAEEERKDD